MAIRSGFFNSVNGDRKYDAKRFAEYFATFIGNGVFPNPSDNLQVISNNDMTVTVKAGRAWINGYILINDNDYIIELTPADGVLNRIDRIVARYDVADREIRLEVKQGDFATDAVAKDLQRDADAYELGLADIEVNAGAISITQVNITDLRLNDNLCGIVHGTVEQVDTTTLFNQYLNWYDDITTNAETDIENIKQQFQDDINLFLEEWQQWFVTTTGAKEQEFNIWFEAIKEQLDGDLGAKLSNQVLELEQIKVDKVAGKGLSTNDYTDEEKQKNQDNTNNILALQQNLDEHKADNTQQAHLAKNIWLEDAAGNFVANNIEGAMSELFTNVSSGKSLVGGAITDVDDSVIIPTDPTFNDLVDAIGQVRTGVSFATGSSNRNSGYDLSIRGLSFRPWIVLCTYYKNSRYVMFLTAYGNFHARLPAEQFFGPQNGRIYDDGFLLEGSSVSGWANSTITWYAWGRE